jgi:GntR family transcriptional regulator
MSVSALDVRLDRDRTASLSEQVRLRLEEAIARGEFRPDSRLPSERALSARFGVSRMTVRAALKELDASGAVTTRHGWGTFVSERKVEQRLSGPTGFTEDVRARGQRPGSRLLEASVIPAALELAQVFRIETGAPLVRIARVRLADGIPLAIETAYVLQRLCPGLETMDLEHESLYATLQDVFSLRPTMARQSIEAAIPTAEERRLLELTVPAPVLRMSRVTTLADGTVLEFVRATYRGDRYLLTVELR